ncbi:hypothetical protein QJS10_CPB13g01041 [Acorus calamus]|uniref:Uncharacterized protein n=1 Tax=Acorus calamus TaxID=4465 RepID=A0AAV9DFS1_ACOCL|nr:hypothetical protein QJS10_CPB13g01041 [Acorus calamus]
MAVDESLSSRSSSSSRLRAGLGIRLSVQFVRVDSLSPACIHPYLGEPVAVSLSSTVFHRLGSSPESTAGLLRLVRSISLWIVGSCRFIDHECKRSEGLLHSHSPLLQNQIMILLLIPKQLHSGATKKTLNEEASQRRLSATEKWLFSTSMSRMALREVAKGELGQSKK